MIRLKAPEYKLRPPGSRFDFGTSFVALKLIYIISSWDDQIGCCWQRFCKTTMQGTLTCPQRSSCFRTTKMRVCVRCDPCHSNTIPGLVIQVACGHTLTAHKRASSFLCGQHAEDWRDGRMDCRFMHCSTVGTAWQTQGGLCGSPSKPGDQSPHTGWSTLKVPPSACCFLDKNL